MYKIIRANLRHIPHFTPQLWTATLMHTKNFKLFFVCLVHSEHLNVKMVQREIIVFLTAFDTCMKKCFYVVLTSAWRVYIVGPSEVSVDIVLILPISSQKFDQKLSQVSYQTLFLWKKRFYSYHHSKVPFIP